jgi:hypothetical protein
LEQSLKTKKNSKNMKTKFYILTLVLAALGMGCNPIEDTSLRDEFAKKGTPISVEELNEALSVTQPFPNHEDKVEGDQYVVINNTRTDIAGTWFVQTPSGVRQIHTDHDTIIYTANNKDAGYSIYFTGLSEGQAVTSKTFNVKVTNLPVNVVENYLTGAEKASDETAKKTWKLMAGMSAYQGMYGNWKYYAFTPGQNSWGSVTITPDLREMTIVFEYGGNKLKTYSGAGQLLEEGTWSAVETVSAGELVIYDLYTTISMPGRDLLSSYLGDSPYWILPQVVPNGDNLAQQPMSGKIEDYFSFYVPDSKKLKICAPSTYTRAVSGEEDWDIDAGYFLLEEVE